MATIHERSIGNSAPTGSTSTPTHRINEAECHIYVDGQWYDCTEWKISHPGGDDIIDKYHMKDASDVFAAFHKKDSYKYLKTLPKVDRSPPEEDPIMKNWRAFRQEVEDQGLLKRQYLWYFYKITTTILIWAAGVALAFNGNWLLSALVLGVFYQQAGWLGHDLAHHCVFENRKIGNFFGYIVSNMLQGFSMSWWKDRHNLHHSITNVLEVDPDIQNLPLFIWDVKDIKHIKEIGAERYLVPYQHLYFLPFTPLLRFIWMIQSFRFVSIQDKHSNDYIRGIHAIEYGSLIMHHVITFLVMIFAMPSVSAAIAWYMISNLLGGWGIAIIVFASHNACELFEPEERVSRHFVDLQIKTTRNIDKGVFMDWWSGGLNYQIEHHLFPTMPRCNLNRFSVMLQKFCKENNLEYQSAPLPTCIKYLLIRLEEVAVAWKKQVLNKI